MGDGNMFVGKKMRGWKGLAGDGKGLGLGRDGGGMEEWEGGREKDREWRILRMFDAFWVGSLTGIILVK